MAFQIEVLEIPEVRKLVPKRHFDDRGYFAETYVQSAFLRAGIVANFVQENESLSAKVGTLRGLHFQRPPYGQTKLVRVLSGAIFDVAVDLRIGSKTYAKWCGAELSSENGAQLLIPNGFAHAFLTLRPNTLVSYKVDSPYAREAEGGVRWDDPDIGIQWPDCGSGIHTSTKDSTLPCLQGFCSPFKI